MLKRCERCRMYYVVNEQSTKFHTTCPITWFANYKGIKNEKNSTTNQN